MTLTFLITTDYIIIILQAYYYVLFRHKHNANVFVGLFKLFVLYVYSKHISEWRILTFFTLQNSIIIEAIN